MKDSVRIVVVGDAKVGKTSIIEVLITETFDEDVQPVLPVLVVPKEVTPERVHVSIVDTPGAPEKVAEVDKELDEADVIVLVYTVDDDVSQGRIATYWLPKFRKQELNVPIILVGNKIDIRGGIADSNASAKMEMFIKPIMDKFREVDVCIECSAKTVSNISEVFYFAQKAVLYPTGPVYDVETQSLRPSAANALRRIFKICDKDRDGGLNDKELNDFQYTCFNVYLQDKELDGVKKVVRDNRPDNGLNADGSLSVEGFIFLHTLFVQKGRLETTWIVLRKFGYDDDMMLTPSEDNKIQAAEDQCVELSQKGEAFLGDIFERADKDKDGLLSPTELDGLFADCPTGKYATKQATLGERLTKLNEDPGKAPYVSIEAFLSRWAMYVLESHEDAMQTLMYLGYPEEVKGALKVSKSRKRDRYARTVSRDVINIGVFGNDEGLQTDIVRGLVELPAEQETAPHARAAVSMDVEGKKKTMVMQHVPIEAAEKLMNSKAALQKFDMICLTFNAGSDESYMHARMLYESLVGLKPDVRMPIVFVAGVAGGIEIEGNAVLEDADMFCLDNKLPTPVRVAADEGEYGNLYEDLMGVAMFPQVACPDYYGSADGGSVVSKVVKIVVGATVVGAVGYGLKRAYDYYTSRPAGSSS